MKVDEVDTTVRKPCKFTQTDVRRALRAVAKEHVLARVDLMPDGRISILPLSAGDANTTTASSDVNEWDEAKL